MRLVHHKNKKIIMITLSFDFYAASYAGINGHPEAVMRDLGYTVLAFKGMPIANCVYMGVDKIIEPLPSYLTVSDFKLSQ